MEAWLLDREPGWEAVVGPLQGLMAPSSRLHFGAVDILLGLEEPVNALLEAELTRGHGMPPIVVFNHVCVENAVRLEEAGFCFFTAMAKAARPGTIFIFIDASPRLYPTLASVMEEAGEATARWEKALQAVHGQGQPQALLLRLARPEEDSRESSLLPAWDEQRDEEQFQLFGRMMAAHERSRGSA